MDYKGDEEKKENDTEQKGEGDDDDEEQQKHKYKQKPTQKDDKKAEGEEGGGARAGKAGDTGVEAWTGGGVASGAGTRKRIRETANKKGEDRGKE